MKSRKVRLGVVAVQIQNPVNNQSTCIYAFQDAGSQLTLLRRSVAKEIGLHGVPIIQSCCGMNSMVERSMEIVNIRIRRLKEPETFEIQDVKLTDVVPELYHSLPNEFNLYSYDNSLTAIAVICRSARIICTYLPWWRKRTPTKFPAPPRDSLTGCVGCIRLCT